MTARAVAATGVLALGTLVLGPGFGQEPSSPPPAQARPAPEATTPAVPDDRSAPASAPSEIVVPAGTTIPVALNTFLNTRSTQVGDNFYADTSYPIWVQQRLVIPRGSIVKGSVTHVERPGRIKGKGRLAIRFESVLLPNGVSRDMVADLRALHGPGVEKIDRRTETIEMAGSQGQDTADIVGTSGQGAIIGAIAGRGAGAGIGAGAGAAVGLGTVLLTRGEDLVLGPGTQFDLLLRQPLRFPHGDIEFSREALSSAERPAWSRPGPATRQQGGRVRVPGRRGFPWLW